MEGSHRKGEALQKRSSEIGVRCDACASKIQVKKLKNTASAQFSKVVFSTRDEVIKSPSPGETNKREQKY